MKRWALVKIFKDGRSICHAVSKDFGIIDERSVQEIAAFLNESDITAWDGLYYAVELDDE